MIDFRGFTKLFGAHAAVRGLDFQVAAGETVALLGPNGSGKTTSLKAAAGLVRPTAGEVLVGAPPRRALEPAARRAISFLPQKVAFPEALTGREVVDFYAALRGVPRGRVDDALNMASLNGASSRAVGTYSGGMVQRLGLAVAVLPDADVLLLDEPTAALDPDGLAAFYGHVEQRRHEGRTVLFTSHQLGDVERLADRFGVLVEGRLVASLGQRELADELARRGVMRLRLAPGAPGARERATALVRGATWQADELVVPGPPSRWPAALETLRAGGTEILALTAEEGRLDQLYRELVERTTCEH